ncbi:MAG: hypothetical protein IIW48_10165 [Clostridia bacterium]|nr:hypothetical protein [Clostridia bacterium]
MEAIKKELSLYLGLKLQLEAERDRMRQLHSKIVYGGIMLKDTPGGKGWSKDKLGQSVERLIDMEREHLETFCKLEERIIRVETWYNSLPDGIYKAALYWHYINGTSWLMTQRKLGNHKSSDALRVGVDYLIHKYKDSF